MDLTTQPYSADTIVPARSIAEASSTCSGNVADVSAVVADLDPSLAGASCFLLERHWNAATSPMFKTPIYMILGATLSFTVSQLGQKSS